MPGPETFRAEYNFVAPHLANKAMGCNCTLIPCGVDFDLFYPMDREEAKGRCQLDSNKKYILFPGDPADPVRNFPLFKTAISLLENQQVGILTMVNKTRPEINEVLNAAEVMVLTSTRAGSPQVVKEAVRCQLPVVSVDVGEVKERLHGLEGSEVVETKAASIAAAIKRVLEMGKRPDYSSAWDMIDNKMVAQKILSIYNSIV